MEHVRRPVSQLVPVLLSGLLVGLLAACSDGTAAAPEPGSTPAAPSTTEPGTLPRLRYVALGDSFTAAPGLAGSTLPCLRSEQNYPALAAEGLGDSYRVRLEDRSCIGADSSALVGEQQLGGGRLPPQLDALDEQTDLVTLSMGGNDEQFFVRLVAGCLSRAEDDPAGSPCADADADAAQPLTDLLPAVRQRLVDAVGEVRRRAPRAEVLLVGYPQLVPARGSCPDRLPLATGDWAFARDANRALDAAVAGAAEDSGARFVDVWAASRGHDVCADEPWVAGQASDAASGAIPFHPLPAGQRAVAERLLDRVGG